MGLHKITRVVVTTEDGREHVYDASGRAAIRNTTTKASNEPKGSLEIVVPLPARWEKGGEGKFIVVDSPLR